MKQFLHSKKFVATLFSAILLMSSSIAFGQLSGVKTIPVDYASISAFVTDANLQGIGAGGVTLNVPAGYTETLTAKIVLTATGTAANPIVIQKSGAGANPVITSYVGTVATPEVTADGMFVLAGSDYVTIDGINLTESAANTTTTTVMEFGYGLYLASASDGCQNNTIKNCTITLNRIQNTNWTNLGHTGSVGINVLNSLYNLSAAAAVTPTAASGSNSFNKFYSNTIQNCNVGITFIGFPATAPFTLANTGNDVGGSSLATGNTIVNFGGGAATNPSTGIFVKDEWGINLSYNTLNNNNGSGVNHATTLRGIFSNASSIGASQNINNNTITLKSAVTTSQVSAIECSAGASGVGNTININNNTITNCTNDLATTSTWYGIYNTGSVANLNINNNNFVNNTTKHTTGIASLIYNSGAVTSGVSMNGNNLSHLLTNTVAQAGTIYYIRNGGGTTTANLNINNNTFASITHTTLSTTSHYFIYNTSSFLNNNINNNTWNNLAINSSGTFYFIYNSTSTQVALNVNNNSITTGFTRLAAAAGTTYFYYSFGSSLGTSTQTMSNNNFSNYSATTLGTGTFYGIYNQDGATAPYPKKTIFNNTFSNITHNSSGSFYGLTVSYLGDGSTTQGTLVYNNTLNNITSQGTQYLLYTGGTASANTPAKFYNNTVTNITNNSTTGSTYGVYGLASGTAPYVEIYNNKIAGLTTATTTGKLYGIYGLSTANYRVHNNYIGSLTASGAMTTTMPAPAIAGIYLSAGTYSLYNNTVYLNAASTGANFSTAALYLSTTGVVDSRNNNFSNASAINGTGLRLGVQNSLAASTNYSLNSNNNNYYLGAPSTSAATYYNGATVAYTIANMNTLTSTDLSSISVAPNFLSTVVNNATYLHIDGALAPTQLESGGQILSQFTTDFDADIRAGNAGYTGTGTSYDIGADEFIGTSPAPQITYTASPALTNLCTTAARTITANVVSASGTMTSVILNYSFNGVAQTPITMTNTTGTTWTGVIPASTPVNAAVTWNIAATNTVPLTTFANGTSYSDEPLFGVNGFAYNTASPVCAGTGSSLVATLWSAAAPVNYSTPTVANPTTDEDMGNITITQGATTILNNTSLINVLTGTIGTATGTAGGYSNFTNSGTYGLTAGQVYNFSISTLSTGPTYFYNNSAAIFIDYNRNGVFTDAGEKVYSAAATSNGAHVETGTFTIPATAFNGLTRMRVLVNEALITAYTNAISYGEFEDYLINITSTVNGGGNVPAITSATWNGIAPIGTGNPLAISPTATDTYTATILSAGCTLVSTPTTVTVNPLPSAPTATNSSQCGTAIPTASVASSAGAAGAGFYNWFNAATAGTLLQSPPIGAYTSFYFNDFTNSTIGTGATLTGTANLTAVTGALELFPNTTSMQGGITVAAGVNAAAYKVEFDVTTATGADGFSYSFGDDVNATATSPAQEKGSGTKLKIGFDSYGVMPDGAGMYLMYNNTMASITNSPMSAGLLAYSNNTSWSGSANNHIIIETNNAGQVTLTLNGTAIFTNIQLPAAYSSANKATWAHVIAGRTGGISSTVVIDNLDIKYAVQIPGSTTFNTPVAATTTYYVSELGTNGCTSATTPITVTVVNPDPMVLTPPTTICQGGTVTLGATSIASPAYTYSWDANTYTGSGFTAPVANASTTVTPSLAGVYTYTVTGTNGICTAVQTVVATINANPVITSATASPSFVCNDNLNVALLASAIVSGPQTMPSYCAITGYGSTGTMINNVSFGTINNNSSASNPTALPYYTSYPLTTNVAIGSTYPLSVTMGPAGTYLGGIVSVWIDYNRDGTYSAAEWQQVNVYALGGSTTTINITIPLTAQVGLTGMRIRSRGNGNINGAGDGCTLFGSGEGEDYQVNIQGAPSVPYTFAWATTPVINTAAGSVTVANTTALPINQDWNVTATNSVTGCTGTATTNTVSIQPAILAPTTVNGAHCGLQATAAAATDVNGFTAPIFNWYATATSVTPLQSGIANTYTTPIATTTTFYVSVTNPVSGCETGRTAVTETVTPAPAFAITSAFTACQNLSYPIAVTTGLSNFTNFVWSGATSLYLDAAMTIPYVTGSSASTVYYASGALGAQPSIICNATDAGVGFAQCSAQASTVVSIQATPITPIIGTTYTTICTGTSAPLNVLSGGAYCNSNATTIYDEEITNVTIGSINNTSDCTTPASGPGSILSEYSNFTTSVAAPNLAAGATITGSVLVNSCGTYSYNSGLAIFIDLNQDGDFLDAGEKVYSNGALANIACVPATTVPISFTIPLGSMNGQTRMRIIDAEYTAGDNITPCLTYGYGETEDYIINITGGVSNSYVWSPAVTNNSTAPSVTSLPLTAQTSFTATLFDGLCYSTPSAPLVIDIAVTPSLAITAAVPTSGYCIPALSYGCAFPDIISNVTIAGINNTTACDNISGANGYSAFTTPTGTLAAGSTSNSYSVTTSGDIEGAAAWIDYNQNGTFEASENIFSGFVGTNPALYSGTFNVPATAINGITKMRVRCIYYTNPGISGACTASTFGETEDYNITITNGAVSTPCPGSTFALNSTVGLGGPPYTYAWSVVSGTATIAAPTNANTTAVINADAVLQLSVTDACGSTTTTTVSTDVLDNPITITPAATAICYNANTVLTANNGTNYTWLPVTGLVSAIGDSVTASPATTTTYTVTGGYGAGCIGTATSVLTVHQLPLVSAGVDQTLCSNVPALLSGTGTSGVVYTWTNNVVNNVPFAVSATNNYIVTATDIYNCINTDTVTINVLAIPNVNGGVDQATCLGGAITLNAIGTGNVSLNWNGGVTNNVPFLPPSSQNYIVTVQAANGCYDYDTVAVTMNAAPVITLTNGASACANGTTTLTATTNNAFGGFWSTTNGNGVITPNISNNTMVYAPGINDPATVNITYIAFNGCGNATQSTTIGVLPIPNVNGGQDVSACTGVSVTLNATATGATSLTWSGGVTNGVAFTPASAQNYIVTALAANGCLDHDTVAVLFNAGPVITLSTANATCANGSATLTATTNNAFGGYWSTSNGSGVITPNVTSNTMIYTPALNDPSTVNISYTANNSCGNASQSTTLTVYQVPTLNAGNDVVVCSGDLVTLNATTNGTLTWNNNVVNGVQFFANAGNTTYTATATNANNCTTTDQVIVTGNALPPVSAGPDFSVCPGGTATLSGTGAATYTWNNGVTNGVGFTLTSGGQYTVTGTDAFGCVATDMVVLSITNVNAQVVFIDPVTLLGNPSNAVSFQWINCTTGAILPGETDDTLRVTANGNYAVIVTTAAGCVDTSACAVVDQVGIFTSDYMNVSLYPNPTNGMVTIQMPNNDAAKLTVFDAQGKLINTVSTVNNGGTVDLSMYTPGVYTFKLQIGDFVHIERIIKN